MGRRHHLQWPALLALLALAGGLAGCRGQLTHEPPIHLNPNMDNVARYDPQEPSDFFADHRAMRPQVAGTVAYGDLREDTHYYQGRVDGELVTTLPAQVELSQALLDRGQNRFNIYCQPCHGAAGYSDGIIVQRGMLQPPSFHEQRLRHEPLGHFFDVMTNGIRNMPSYAAQIPVQDRWAIAAYVRALQVSQAEQVAVRE